MLFSDCGNVADCQDCTTAEEICFEQCGQNFEGPLEENVLEIIPGVEDELSCKAKLYTPSTPNIDLILWHTHLIVCAVK